MLLCPEKQSFLRQEASKKRRNVVPRCVVPLGKSPAAARVHAQTSHGRRLHAQTSRRSRVPPSPSSAATRRLLVSRLADDGWECVGSMCKHWVVGRARCLSVGKGRRGLAAALAARLLLVRQLDLVGELVVELHVRLLGERVLCHRLERLLHVQGLLGARLEVRDAVL